MPTRPLRPRAATLAAALLLGTLATPLAGGAQSAALRAEIERRVPTVMPKVVSWRRDIHQHPELSGEETRTAALVAAHLKGLGIETRTGVGGHGVVGVLRGGKPGPVVALRADMDGLPVTEQVEVPFRSRVTTTYNGQTVGVMHACGHDNHVAILMGAAELLAGMQAQLPGTVVFLFQPAEEMKPNGEGGAEPMLREGALDNPKVDAVFGLHVTNAPLGQVAYRAGPAMASANMWKLLVRGKQTHGAKPWAGVDPVVVGAQIVNAYQTIVSRQVDITDSPAIVTVGAFNGGVRGNIIPDSAVMLGTVRAFSDATRDQIFARMRAMAEAIAGASGATAALAVDAGYPVTANDPALTERMLPTMRWAANGKTAIEPLRTGSEDFSFFARKAPTLFVMLGVTPADQDPEKVATNHSPFFFADEAALPVGVRTMAGFAVDYLAMAPRK